MKRIKFIFPLMFLIAMAGSAFTQHAKSAKAGTIDAWYQDTNWNTCVEIELDDDKCFPDNVAYPCMEYIGGFGFLQMWQESFGNTCYQPYYQYVPFP